MGVASIYSSDCCGPVISNSILIHNHPQLFKMENKFSGTIGWFLEAKGYGFILRDDGGEIFFHESEIEMEGQKFLVDGQKVEFEISKDIKGRDKAINIRKIK